jgi:phosphohistidine phosphatase
MKTLLILRHAKSSRDEPYLPDHDRPLTERGKRDAERIGTLLLERQLVPELILSSTAKRARKTASRVAQACGSAEEIQMTSRLYEAHPSQFIELLREVEDRHATVLVVAHNPGLEGLVWHLTGQRESLPTAALAQVTLPIDRWQDLGVPPGGQLVQVWRPKEL